MKKWVLSLLSVFIIISGSNIAVAEIKREVDYEKWGKIAVEVAKENYDQIEISEYKYLGRKNVSETEAIDTFELLAKEGQKSFQIIVALTFNPQTKQLKSLTIEEKKSR
ncbi:DUF3889 domain-containing protein [Sutcliffiella rhizosphaerae]|uniref:DUF3889 domain-containing protein n=1 Tax=Sutcliffiella rhizosphaerae TaxID=2880967 RepID=A0ABN8A9C9_9BACI|nr:DUF3889 domain-containing protein [Sutcliffiella rhizosphaerae]CAG9621766.1 hypothetical protein BACCIP111883_02539 [Sutcliffiella rhizosphaerae]